MASLDRRRPRSERLSDGEFRALVDEARSRHNVSDIIGRHTDLKPRGNSRKEQVGLCPFHAERTPSFEVNDEKGTYHCWGCGVGGDAITFLRQREGMTFRQAIETLTGETFPVVSAEDRARRKAQAEQEIADRIALARSIWDSGVAPEGTPAEVYARSRGITTPLPSSIRFAMTPRWRDAETGEVGRDHPAMLCALQDAAGEIVGVHAVFLQKGGAEKYQRRKADGAKAKAKLSFGLIVGAAFRLGPPSERVIVCEGPENGLSLLQSMPGQPVWVSCGASLLQSLTFPPEVRSVVLAGDNDAPGRRAVATAHEVYASAGLSVQEVFPATGFKDWNDQLRGVKL